MKPSTNFAKGRNTSRLTDADYRRIAEAYSLKPPHVQAVVQVEAGTAGFWNDGNMKLLYEGHIAYRETSGDLRKKLLAAGVAWRSWGDVAYGPASQSRERLRTAVEIAGDDAYRWASYGLGQVMGFNADVCSYSSGKAMFDAFLAGEPTQVDGMMRFIKGKGLLQALKNCDWKKFAYGYNGTGYAKNKYDTRLEQAFRQFSGGATTVDPWADGILTIGDKGEAVREVQAFLGITVDGAFGRATAQAVRAYQKANGLVVDGIVGKQTYAAMKPAPVQTPVAPAPTKVAVGVGITAIIAAGASWLANLPCQYLNLFCGG